MVDRSRLGGWKSATLIASALAAFVLAEPANASVCSQLQREYLSASGGSSGGGSAKARRQLAQAQAEAKRNNCRRLGIFVKPSKQCPAIMRKIGRLQSQVGRASFSRQPSSRDRLRRELRRNGCEIPSGGTRLASSGYKTLCVRTCDGYYFPVSFRSSRSRFKTDEAVCKAMYGGAEAELFYHANGDTAERAISVSGRRQLAAEPYAFAYRTRFDPSCQGELKTGLANLEKIFGARIAAAKANKSGAKGIAQPTIFPVPAARIERSEDPETLASRAGGFVPAPVTPDTPGGLVVATEEIRRLGPEYYYVAPQAIDALYEPPDLGPEFSLISSAQASERVIEDADQPGSTVVQ